MPPPRPRRLLARPPPPTPSPTPCSLARPRPCLAARPSRPPLLRFPLPCRCFTTASTSLSTAQYHIGPVSTQEYHAVSDLAMDALTEYLEALIERVDAGQNGWDVEYSAGVLTLNLGEKGTYVINKQPPNKQIWLSSPLSGPKRYDYDANHKVWFYHRDGTLMNHLLDEELKSLLGTDDVQVDLGQETT